MLYNVLDSGILGHSVTVALQILILSVGVRIPVSQPVLLQYGNYLHPSSSRSRTPPFHGGNRGSSPLGCTKNGQVAEWLNAADCKSAPSGYGGSNPSLSTNFLKACNSVVRVSVLYAGGRWFESIQAYQFFKQRRKIWMM